jgi:putative transcriptional regulator
LHRIRSCSRAGEENIVTILAPACKVFRGGQRSALPELGGYDIAPLRKTFQASRISENKGDALFEEAREENHGCTVHIPDAIDVRAIRAKVDMSQSEFAKLFGFSKRSLEHWEHERRVPTGPARAFLTVIAREPEAVRRALMDASSRTD